MGKKKYFCEFCNRSFNDDHGTRQKHMLGTLHIRNKKEHYNLFRDAETVLKEESVKKPCRKFHNEGYCSFGGTCTFSHYTQNDLEALKYEIHNAKTKKDFPTIPSIDSWLLKRKTGGKLQIEKDQIKISMWSHELPAQLQSLSAFLPPSIQPFHISDYLKENTSSWG